MYTAQPALHELIHHVIICLNKLVGGIETIFVENVIITSVATTFSPNF